MLVQVRCTCWCTVDRSGAYQGGHAAVMGCCQSMRQQHGIRLITRCRTCLLHDCRILCTWTSVPQRAGQAPLNPLWQCCGRGYSYACVRMPMGLNDHAGGCAWESAPPTADLGPPEGHVWAQIPARPWDEPCRGARTWACLCGCVQTILQAA